MGEPTRRNGRLVFGVAIALVVAAVDQWVKTLVVDRLTPGVFVPLFGEHVGWQLVFNPGGAWGIPAPSWVFLIVTVVVTVVVVRLLPRAVNNWQVVGLGLLLAGALGNVIDRLVRAGDPWFGGGHVVDFVAWGSFPRFNVADASITVGFVVLLLTTWLHERQQDVAEDHADDEGGTDDDGADAPR